VAALRRRARDAVAEAERAVSRSQTLTAARRLLHERALLKRCAWCGRISLGRGWTASDDLPHFVPESVRANASHGICPTCLERLARDGDSRTVERRG
jgi:hypothetical protein